MCVCVCRKVVLIFILMSSIERKRLCQSNRHESKNRNVTLTGFFLTMLHDSWALSSLTRD